MAAKGRSLVINPIQNIRNLIRSYDSGSIIKEYLQNAADAGASELVVTLDRRHHSQLVGTVFEKSCGPALMFWNDSTFSEHDFDSICETYREGKSENAFATGQFGQGFNGSYSVSDDPILVSSGKVLWFDVHKHNVGKLVNDTIAEWGTDDPELEAMKPAVSVPGKGFNSGTTFRLPLRSKSNNSKISNTVFDTSKFYEWIKEWRHNAQNLLFVRNIRKLSIQEIFDDNDVIVHLEIETINEEEIKKIQSSINAQFYGIKKPKDLCDYWLSKRKKLESQTYTHSFITSYWDAEKEQHIEHCEHWAVCNGLFAGDDNKLIKLAKEIVSSGSDSKKVLPWAGVAALIKSDFDDSLISQGKLYTFLPLPTKSEYPVNIHGWFDVDSGRLDITRLPKEGNINQKLLAWNKMLMECGVGVAWAKLASYVKKEIDLNYYFRLWPNRQKDEFYENVSNGFFKEITSYESLLISYKGEDKWTSPLNPSFLLPAKESERLFQSLSKSFPLVKGKIPSNIRQELVKRNINIKELKPKDVADFFSKRIDEHELPITLSELGLSSITTIEELIDVIKFCIGDKNDFSVLQKAPISLALDGKVYPCNHPLISSNSYVDVSSLLQGHTEFLLHPQLEDIFENGSNTPSNWYSYSLSNLLNIIGNNFDSFERSSKWIEDIVQTVSSGSEQEQKACEVALTRLPIIALESGDWEYASNSIEKYCPFILPSRIESNLNELHSLNLNIIKIEKSVLYKKLNKHFELVRTLTPAALALHVIKNKEIGFCEDDIERAFVLDYIGKDLGWVEKLKSSEIDFLLSIPFVKVESGNCVALRSTRQLFISEKFSPPTHIEGLHGEYDLAVDESHNIRALLKKLGVKERNAFHYATHVIIPFIEKSQCNEDRLKALEWLSSEWKEIKLRQSDENVHLLLHKLSESRIVPPIDGGPTVRPRDVYSPSFAKSLPKIFQDTSRIPVELGKDDDDWQCFLEDVGANNNLLVSHILHVVNDFIDKGDRELSISFWNYIIDNYEDIKKIEFNNKSILRYLSNLRSMPVLESKKLLQPNTTFSVFAKPNSLILTKSHSLLGGIYHCVDNKIKLGDRTEDDKELLQSLGIIVKLKWDDVLRNFDKVTSLDASSAKEENEILKYAKSFYTYVGRDSNAEKHIPQSLRQKSIRINNFWVSSRDVFQRSLPTKLVGVYAWTDLVADKNEATQKGLEKLGVKSTPSPSYIAQHLSDDSLYPIGKPLEESKLSTVQAILRWLSALTENELSECSAFPLLDHDGALRHCEDLFINDWPAYLSSPERNKDLFFVSDDSSTHLMLAEKVGVRKLSEDSYHRIDVERSVISNSEVKQECRSLESYLKTEGFQLALIRLIADKEKLDSSCIEELSSKQLVPEQFIYCEQIIVDYFSDSTWIFTDNSTSSYLDEETSSLYLLPHVDYIDMLMELTVSIADKTHLDGLHHECISHILRERLSREDIDKFLDRRKMTALPSGLASNESDTIFGEQYEPSEDSLNYQNEHTSLNSQPENEAILTSDHAINGGTNDTAENDSIRSYEEPERITPPKDNGTTSSKVSRKNLESTEHEGVNRSERKIKGTLSLNREKSKVGEGSSTGSKNDRELPPPVVPKQRMGESENKTYKDSQSAENRKAREAPQNTGPSTPNTSKSRYPVYVYEESTTEESDSSFRDDAERTEIGDRGESLILKNSNDFVLSSKNKLVKAPVNQEGFDITEVSENGEIVRYIEVKTREKMWGLTGVAVTKPQFEFALKHDNWWLFVVENISEESVIHPIPNPVQRVNRFVFDNSWKQLANSTESGLCSEQKKPEQGDHYYIPAMDEIVEVLSVEPRNTFTKVKYKKLSDNSEKVDKYNSTWELM